MRSRSPFAASFALVRSATLSIVATALPLTSGCGQITFGEDLGSVLDAGFEDPVAVDAGFLDTGLPDAGFPDAGFVNPDCVPFSPPSSLPMSWPFESSGATIQALVIDHFWQRNCDICHHAGAGPAPGTPLIPIDGDTGSLGPAVQSIWDLARESRPFDGSGAAVGRIWRHDPACEDQDGPCFDSSLTYSAADRDVINALLDRAEQCVLAEYFGGLPAYSVCEAVTPTPDAGFPDAGAPDGGNVDAGVTSDSDAGVGSSSDAGACYCEPRPSASSFDTQYCP